MSAPLLYAKKSLYEQMQEEYMGQLIETNDLAVLYDALRHCNHDSDDEFEIYKRIVELMASEIHNLREDLECDVINPITGELLGWNPTMLDEFAAPMDNLARFYIMKGEYAKALALLEQALPVYRTLEIYNPDYTYQRCYAIKAIVECYEKLGKENLAIFYGYELKHLQRDVLDKRETDIKNQKSESYEQA